ncbi:MAG: DpnI domain-containing protein [Patescibacteria group bacterium]
MNLSLDISFLKKYKSGPQRSKNMTESWVAREMFCLDCGADNMFHLKNHSKVRDFVCLVCKRGFELKGRKRKFENRISAGAYQAIFECFSGSDKPHFLFLQYNDQYKVQNFYAIPRRFFRVNMLEKRKPLPKTAKRAGWIGSYLHMDSVPESVKMYVVRDGVVTGSKKSLLKEWKKILRN